jgi:hypothetical protein
MRFTLYVDRKKCHITSLLPQVIHGCLANACAYPLTTPIFSGARGEATQGDGLPVIFDFSLEYLGARNQAALMISQNTRGCRSVKILLDFLGSHLVRETSDLKTKHLIFLLRGDLVLVYDNDINLTLHQSVLSKTEQASIDSIPSFRQTRNRPVNQRSPIIPASIKGRDLHPNVLNNARCLLPDSSNLLGREQTDVLCLLQMFSILPSPFQIRRDHNIPVLDPKNRNLDACASQIPAN